MMCSLFKWPRVWGVTSESRLFEIFRIYNQNILQTNDDYKIRLICTKMWHILMIYNTNLENCFHSLKERLFDHRYVVIGKVQGHNIWRSRIIKTSTTWTHSRAMINLSAIIFPSLYGSIDSQRIQLVMTYI